MKKFYFTLVTFLFLAIANAQIVNIPDANLKAYLLAASPFNYTASTQTPDSNGHVITYHKIDTNNDGEIQVSEASVIKYIVFYFNVMSNLEGINSFVNLESISFTGVLGLSSIDVSNLVNLKYFGCEVNSMLSSLNVDNLTNLVSLSCIQTPLTSIDVSGLINLKKLYCQDNNLQNLNVSNLISLEYLDCSNNQLTSLTTNGLNSLQSLICSYNHIESLDVNELSNLNLLDCSVNYLTTLLIKNNNNSLYVNFITNPYLTYICANENYVANVQNRINQYGYTNCTVDSNCNLSVDTNLYDENYFTIYPNPVDEVLNLTSKQDTEVYSLTVYNLLGQQVQTTTNPNNTVDVSSLKTGNYIVKVVTDKGVSSSKFVKE